MGKYRLVDVKGRQLKLIEAESMSHATLHGLRNYPGKFHRSVDVGAEEARREAGYQKIKASFRQGYLKEGKSPEEAERLAQIAAEGRSGRPHKAGDLKATIKRMLLEEGLEEAQADKAAEIAVQGR